MINETATLRVRDYGETWVYPSDELAMTVDCEPVTEVRFTVGDIETVPWAYAQAVEAQIVVDDDTIHDDEWLALEPMVTHTTDVDGQLNHEVTLRETPHVRSADEVGRVA
ncbi:hypothetical protein PN419_00070 [Halorubrum ezzemoulense]|uniref:hypothetical protein n=1 Tax=Halorubrum ezzemoulense TaxID=337243 RepID=UPI00232B3DD3|nr:hypothetical protein [Halorubrum ezzemoulense]MDB9247402.1 hypothetical protein [Halorubrum ezzemoulense]MDB9258689.1 hypothetical protein [Halorubrum ezzemoulense]MDB9264453.1 hypothetical protein [Halorubrum ezzemoulense]MDB9269050.1 hypothetical protein [Halorubrum ezzemoulense]MDB9271421.1 hypothetical protein [Halorubrum ezzemoulense]